MAVLPGSLDYLYYNGILDHIPYEAYEMGPVTASGMGYNQMNPMVSSGMSGYNQMNGSQYIDQAKQGLLYDTYTSPDTFVKRNPNEYRQGQDYSFGKQAFGVNNGIGVDSNLGTKTFGINDGIGRDSDFEVKAVGDEGKSFRESLVDSAKSTASGFSNAPTFVKGLIAGGIMVGTLFCLLRGKKTPSPAVTQKTSFWSKLNPKNWFKK